MPFQENENLTNDFSSMQIDSDTRDNSDKVILNFKIPERKDLLIGEPKDGENQFYVVENFDILDFGRENLEERLREI